MNTTISSDSTFHYQVIEEVTDDFTKEHRYLLVVLSEGLNCAENKRTIGVA